VTVECSSRLPQNRLGRAKATKDFGSLRRPEQFGKSNRINSRVRLEQLHRIKFNTDVRCLQCNLDPPPVGKVSLGLLSMLFPDNQRRPIKDGRINRHLPRKSLKGISIALDFVAVEVAVNNGDIDTARPMAQA